MDERKSDKDRINGYLGGKRNQFGYITSCLLGKRRRRKKKKKQEKREREKVFFERPQRAADVACSLGLTIGEREREREREFTIR